MSGVGPMPRWRRSCCDSLKTQTVDLVAFRMPQKKSGEEEYGMCIWKLKVQATRGSQLEATKALTLELSLHCLFLA